MSRNPLSVIETMITNAEEIMEAKQTLRSLQQAQHNMIGEVVNDEFRTLFEEGIITVGINYRKIHARKYNKMIR